MPSSTSNSSIQEDQRLIPSRSWIGMGIMALVFALLLTGLWEYHWRSQGYYPTLNDNRGLWAQQRARVDKEPDGTIVVGASRTLFDFHLKTYEKAFGQKPIQLSTVGTNINPYLHDIADNTDFRGTLLVGVTPGLFFVPVGMPIKRSRGNVKYYKNLSINQQVSQHLGMFLERRLAFLLEYELSLPSLIKSVKLPNRAKFKKPRPTPPYFMDITEDRQGIMTQKTEKDKAFQKHIQEIWIPLITPPPTPPIFTPAQFKKIIEKSIVKTLTRTRAAIKKIQDRGGKVILIRFPSTEKVRATENKYSPRKANWDRVQKALKAPGIHFEDYPTLRGFKCPEWSHLNGKDAKIFTERLVPIIKQKLQALKSPARPSSRAKK